MQVLPTSEVDGVERRVVEEVSATRGRVHGLPLRAALDESADVDPRRLRAGGEKQVEVRLEIEVPVATLTNGVGDVEVRGETVVHLAAVSEHVRPSFVSQTKYFAIQGIFQPGWLKCSYRKITKE